MAFGGCGEDMEKELHAKNVNATDKSLTVSEDNFEQSESNDPTLEDFLNNADSLSSSASMSDSDLTSTDSDDSLALSESESITDVTPLNSPYCDSPLPHGRLLELRSEERSKASMSPPEVNVLMKAIEKLEVEARKNELPRVSSQRRRTVSCGVEEGKRLEQENQRLFKRVISQQNRMRTMYPNACQPSRKNLSITRHQDLVRSDGDVSGLPKNIQSLRGLKDAGKYAQRQQKCLSHPSYSFSHGPLTNTIILADDGSSDNVDQATSGTSLQGTSAVLSYDIESEKHTAKD